MTAENAKRLAHFRIVRRLGAGGMGEVFLAQDTDLDRPVAIKILSPDLARDEVQHQRFRTEARAASALVHPNICVIYEVGETEDGRPFLAMEYIDGQTLDHLMRERRLRIREVIEIGIEVAEALAASHDSGIVHRDIKPANIMLDSRGHAKVLDFGLAKRFGREALANRDVAAAQTRTGTVLGSLPYMSPEQALGRDLDPRSDIFSLGAVLYELLAGKRAFPSDTTGEAINNIVNSDPEPLQVDNPLFSPTLEQIVLKCLEKDPDKRHRSARELAGDLSRLKSETDEATTSLKTLRLPASALPDAQPHRVAGLGNSLLARLRRPGWLAGLLLLVLLVLGGWFLVRSRSTSSAAYRATGPSSNYEQKSIAVLPFANFSSEGDTEYLSDGLTEEITSALSRVPGLRVAARNSAFVFKGKQENARVLGKALRVDALLEGSIRKVGNQLRVTAQLINVGDGFQLWSEKYDRPLDDLLKVQEEIALQIVRRLEAGSGIVTGRRAPSPNGYRFYLQGLQAWNKRTESGLTNAILLFTRSVEKDPGYADAHAGLAAAYLLLPGYAPVRRSEYAPLARAAANRALELDPSCAHAHAVLGHVQWAARDLKGAEQHFRRALQLDPSYATAHHWYGLFLMVHERREALPELEAAVALDPLSPVIRASIPQWHYFNHDPDKAIQEARNVIAAFPDFPVVRIILGNAQMQKGLFAEALAEVEAARALEPEKPLAYLDLKAFALARSGQEPEARKILALFEQCRDERKPVEAPLALIYQGLREYDKAIDALERLAAAEGLEDSILCDPCYKELRVLPRFQLLLERTGLAEPVP